MTPGRRLDLVARDLNPELVDRLAVPEARGALVAKIKYESEAYAAGLRAGDVILMFDGFLEIDSEPAEQAREAKKA